MVMMLKIAFPKCVYIIRGNHELEEVQEETEDGFLDQLEEVYGEDQGPRQLHHSAECSTFGKIFNMDNNDFA